MAKYCECVYLYLCIHMCRSVYIYIYIYIARLSITYIRSYTVLNYYDHQIEYICINIYVMYNIVLKYIILYRILPY